jgi:hypothetical protein
MNLTDHFEGQRYNAPNDICVDGGAASISPIRVTGSPAAKGWKWISKGFTDRQGRVTRLLTSPPFNG